MHAGPTEQATRLKEALRQRGHPIDAAVRRPHGPADATARELVRRTLAALDRA